MPWKETTTMEQKVEFICEWRTGKYAITELCKSFSFTSFNLCKDRFDVNKVNFQIINLIKKRQLSWK